MNHCIFFSRLAIENGELVKILKAKPTSKKAKDWNPIDVYKETENNKYFCKHLYYTCIGGYVVAFPNKDYNYYYGKIKEKKSPYFKTSKLGIYSRNTKKSFNNATKLILSKYPDFSYTLNKVINKYGKDIDYLFNVLKIWKNHKDIELIIDLKLPLVFNKSFYRLNKILKKKVIKFYQNNYILYNRPNYNEVLEILKYNISSDDFFKFRDYKQHSCYGLSKKLCNYNIYKYINKITKNEEITDVVRFYDDYLYMLEHNHTKHEKSDYWLFPNTYEKLCKLHDKLMQEETAYNEFIRQEREKEEQEKKRNRNKKYSKIVSKYNDFSSIVDGFSIFVPQNTSLWQKQAEVLNQCIISSNYIDKVVDKSSVLIFIQKNDVPIATVEIGKNNQILQFYCDEHDRQNCKPTEQLRNTFNLWLKDKIFFDKTEKKCA